MDEHEQHSMRDHSKNRPQKENHSQHNPAGDMCLLYQICINEGRNIDAAVLYYREQEHQDIFMY